jgi:S-formylglutathione hydrolase FrmB
VLRKAAFLLVLLAASAAQAEVRPGSFFSASLGRDVSYVVDLPEAYARGDRSYPVVYALHGLFESPAFWEGRGLATILASLRSKGLVPDFVVVAVDGGNSFYVNGPGGAYEDLVTRDAIAHVEASYRVEPGRGGRALLGVSMGGYAALRIALKRPELFAAVATHSAMLLEKPPNAADGARRGQMAAFGRAFGEPIDLALWSAADPLELAQRADAGTTPALYFDCGSDDRYGLAAGNRRLHELLAARGIRHEFALNPGDHGYEYVRSVLEKSLSFLGRALDGAGGAIGRVAPAPNLRPQAAAKEIR